MTTFISGVLPFSVAVRPKIALGRQFKNVDNKQTPFYHPCHVSSPIGSAASYSLSPSEHWPVYNIRESGGRAYARNENVAGDDIPQDVFFQL